MFFLFDNRERAEDVELLADMIKFSKTYAAGLEEDNKTRKVTLFIPNWHDTLKQYALKHGFVRGDWEEETYIMPISKKLEVCLPEGYTITAVIRMRLYNEFSAYLKRYGKSRPVVTALRNKNFSR